MATACARKATQPATTSRASSSVGAQRPSSRAQSLRVVAQAQPLRAPDSAQPSTAPQQPLRAVQMAAAAVREGTHAESLWFEDLARFLNLAGAQTPQEDEEWRHVYRAYLDHDEEHGKAGHGMFVSHLAERLAMEPNSRR